MTSPPSPPGGGGGARLCTRTQPLQVHCNQRKKLSSAPSALWTFGANDSHCAMCVWGGGGFCPHGGGGGQHCTTLHGPVHHSISDTALVQSVRRVTCASACHNHKSNRCHIKARHRAHHNTTPQSTAQGTAGQWLFFSCCQRPHVTFDLPPFVDAPPSAGLGSIGRCHNYAP